MSCESGSLEAQITSTLFFLHARGAAARPARRVRQRRGGAARSAACKHFLWQLGKTSRAGSSLALRRRLLLAEQDAESSADSRSWLDHAHLRIFHFT